MRFSNNIGIAVLALTALLSCAQEVYPQVGEGYLDLKVGQDTAVDIVPVTRSGDAAPVIAVQIRDVANDTLAFECDDWSQINEPLKLKTTSYKAFATSGTEGGAAAWDSPFYSGTAEFTIRPREVTTASIECALSTVMVTAVFSQEIKDNFTYSLEVSNGLGTLVYDGTTENREGYFAPASSISWVLTLVNADKEVFEVRDEYTDVHAQQHYALSFSMDEPDAAPAGAADFKIILNDALNAPTVHEPTILIYESAPSVIGADEIVKYVTDPVVGSIYQLHSGREYTDVTIMHDNDVMESLGLAKSVELTTTSLDEFAGQCGILITLHNELEETLPAFDATVSDVKIDVSAFANSLPVGDYSFDIFIRNTSGMSFTKKVTIVVNSSFSPLILDPWAEFVYVKGGWTSVNQPENITVQYKKRGVAEWTDFVPADGVITQFTMNTEARTFRAFICGLDSETDYDIRVVSTTEELSSSVCKTDVAEQVYNSNFDLWHTLSGVPYPYELGADPTVWDTANGGTQMMSKTPTTQETSDVKSGSAVRMESMFVGVSSSLGAFAAGNLYTGVFKKADTSTMSAQLDWGTPFSGRPLALKGHYKYTPAKIDYAEGDYSSLKGEYDKCQIQIALTTQATAFKIDTGIGQFVDFSHENEKILSHNVREEGTTNGQWVSFTMYCDYRSNALKNRPKSIIISACASYLGDYFTGGAGSVMLVDEFELEYDPLALAPADRDAFFALFE